MTLIESHSIGVHERGVVVRGGGGRRGFGGRLGVAGNMV